MFFSLCTAGLGHVSTSVVGTVGYAAPEYVYTGRLTAKSAYGALALCSMSSSQEDGCLKELYNEARRSSWIFTPQRRVRSAATAAKSSGGGSEEKGILDFILGSLTKQDQFYETDPILKKVEDGKNSGTTGTGTNGGRKNSVVVPPAKKKDGGFGGLGGFFPKK
ncbi:hypothetical protein AAHA92_21901 [Salvia divinorum]|uniref:Uncharacterized protein n=1 Tax=Salvia divinorum TaxID=28513 RepID=A0ABD1GLY5_SALDI